MTVWLDGVLCDPEVARIDPSDRGFLLGDGVFETIRAEAGAARHLPLHLARLRAGAAVLGIPLAWADGAIADAVASVLAASKLAEAAVRITLTGGPGPRGVLPAPDPRPTVLVAAAPLPPKLPPARLVIARSTCRNEASPLARIKSLNYGDSILARREAAARGADDAILLNTRGAVAEATAANLFVLFDEGPAATPPVADGALPGILRGRLLAAGLAVERRLNPDDLRAGARIVLGNSLGLRVAASIEARDCDAARAARWVARVVGR
jgi:branched-chain amino acid aminotransferase